MMDDEYGLQGSVAESFSLPSLFERRVGVELDSTLIFPFFPFCQVLDLTEKTWCQE
jgi:hypothetical protein